MRRYLLEPKQKIRIGWNVCTMRETSKTAKKWIGIDWTSWESVNVDGKDPGASRPLIRSQCCIQAKMTLMNME